LIHNFFYILIHGDKLELIVVLEPFLNVYHEIFEEFIKQGQNCFFLCYLPIDFMFVSEFRDLSKNIAFNLFDLYVYLRLRRFVILVAEIV